MCDYSLRLLASRPAKSGDRLVLTRFNGTLTRGFSAVGDPETAVCLLPGTQIAFRDDVTYERRFPWFRPARVRAQVATFVRVAANVQSTHHDALEFPDGKVVLITRLCEGQQATVLQLPAGGARESARPADAAAADIAAVF